MHLIYRMGAEHHSWVCDYSYLNAFNLSNGGGASQFLYVSEIAVGRVCIVTACWSLITELLNGFLILIS